MAKKTTIQKVNHFKAVAQSLMDKGKLTLSKHFADAADLIEEQRLEIVDLKKVSAKV